MNAALRHGTVEKRLVAEKAGDRSGHIAAAIGGIGAGAVYGTCIGATLKWFPDRRGFAAGLTAAGFGAGSALTVVPCLAALFTGCRDAGVPGQDSPAGARLVKRRCRGRNR
jgi:hypothetical protein